MYVNLGIIFVQELEWPDLSFFSLTDLAPLIAVLNRRTNSNAPAGCAPGTQTYVQVRMLGTAAVPIVDSILNAGYTIAMAHIHAQADEVIGNGGFYVWCSTQGLTLRTWNTNNHQMTFGVVGAAFLALRTYMDFRTYGPAKFKIFDGPNEVGAGTLD